MDPKRRAEPWVVYTWHDRAKTRGDGGVGVGQVERSSAGGRTRDFTGFDSLGLKTVQKAGFLVWASKPRSGELSEAKQPRNVPRHVEKGFGWFGPQNHQVGGFPGFSLKTGGGAWRCLKRCEGCVDGSRTLRGVEARCAKYSRPSDEEGKRNRRKRPCVGCLSQIGEGHLCKMNMGCLRLLVEVEAAL